MFGHLTSSSSPVDALMSFLIECKGWDICFFISVLAQLLVLAVLLFLCWLMLPHDPYTETWPESEYLAELWEYQVCMHNLPLLLKYIILSNHYLFINVFFPLFAFFPSSLTLTLPHSIPFSHPPYLPFPHPPSLPSSLPWALSIPGDHKDTSKLLGGLG